MSVAIIAPQGGTASASSSGAGTSAASLLTIQPTDVWQANVSGSATIYLDRGANAGTFDTVAVLFTNIPVSSTIQVRAASSQANLTSSPSYVGTQYTLTTFPGASQIQRRHIYERLPTPNSSRWVSVTVNTGALKFMAGRLVVGLAWEPLVHYNSPIRGFEGGLTETITVGGQAIIERQEARPTISLELAAQTRAEFETYAMILERFNSEVLVAIDAEKNSPQLQHRLYYGILQGRGISDDSLSLWRHRIEVRGLL